MMKKSFFITALAVILCFLFSMATLAASPRVFDQADVLTDVEEEVLLAQLDEASEQNGVDIVVAIVSSCNGETIQYHAEELYYSGDFNHDGVMLIVSMEERQTYIYRSGLGETALTADEGDAIIESISVSLSGEDYMTAFTMYADECAYQIDGEINGFPFKFGRNLIISLVIGFVVAFIVTGVMRGQLKSVRQQPGATEYTKPGSMQVTVSNDFFLYRTVTRRKKEKNNSSSGGSSRDVSVGKF